MREEVCDCNIIHKDKVDSTKKKMLNDVMFDKVGTFFKVVGDDTRLRILFALDNNEMCVCDIANLLNMTKSSISHQLKLLKDHGLVKNRKSGKEVYYMLDDDHVASVIEVATKHVIHKEEE
jgi:ArsR family transcriptional regulator